MGTLTYSSFATGLNTETAFDVLAVANKLKAAGKEVYALQIGDSPFPSSTSALQAGKDAIDAGLTRYCPSLGLPAFREAAAKMVKDAIPNLNERTIRVSRDFRSIGRKQTLKTRT